MYNSNGYCKRHGNKYPCEDCSKVFEQFHDKAAKYICIQDSELEWLMYRVNEKLTEYEPLGGVQITVVTSNSQSSSNFGILPSSHNFIYSQSMIKK